ncbi:MAG: hydrogenase nickel incorporation protein HypB [Candidatus Brocadiia bacterium]
MAKIDLNKSAQERNQPTAEQNRQKFRDADVFVVNLIGSPGCGKTAILEYTARHCPGNFAVIVGDVQTALDADRILECDIPAYPIETGGTCHLSAKMIANTIADISLEELDYLFIENVGNLVCPSTMDLGENIKVGVVSVPEGDEKVRKYPALFLRTNIVFINKTDLLEHCQYDVERVKADCRKARPDVKVFEVSAAEGGGFEPWLEFLRAISP